LAREKCSEVDQHRPWWVHLTEDLPRGLAAMPDALHLAHCSIICSNYAGGNTPGKLPSVSHHRLIDRGRAESRVLETHWAILRSALHDLVLR
jgi:hypothetical protein